VLLEDGPEHEVEAVMAHRYVGKKLQYLIKFKGYDHVYDEWLPPSHLHCAELLQEYLASPAYARSTEKIRTAQAKKQAKSAAANPPRRSRRRRQANANLLAAFLASPVVLT